MACDSRRQPSRRHASCDARGAQKSWSCWCCRTARRLAGLAALSAINSHRLNSFVSPQPSDPSGLVARAPRSSWSRGRRETSRASRLGRRGLPELAILGGFALLGTLRPRSAPGPSERLLKDAEAARKAVKGSKRDKLQEALKQLAYVESQLEAATGDQLDYPLPDYLKPASESGKIMLAITGASGVGKSSLVNALRRVKDSDADAAETGVQETTTEPTMYSFRPAEGLFQQRFYRQWNGEEASELPLGQKIFLEDGKEAEVLEVLDHQKVEVRLDDGSTKLVDFAQVAGLPLDVVIWDLPGAGTPNFPQASYLKRMGIRYFDVALLVTSSRFTEAELMLARELEKFEVPYFMVRNKVDVDIDSEILKEEESHDDEAELSKEQKEEVAKQTIECIKEYFKIEYGLEEVYCVSARRKLRKVHDFPRLEEDILEAVRLQRSG